SIAINGFAKRTRLVAGAAGAVASSQTHILVPPHEPKNAAVVAEGHEGSIVVPTFTIDELAAELDRVDLVKIDVEGSEINVIAGMRETIAKHCPAIMLEFNALRYADPGAFLHSLMQNYSRVRKLGWEGELEPTTPELILAERSGEDSLL